MINLSDYVVKLMHHSVDDKIHNVLVHEVEECRRRIGRQQTMVEEPTSISALLKAATAHEFEFHPRAEPKTKAEQWTEGMNAREPKEPDHLHDWRGYDVPTDPLMVYCTKCEATRPMGS